SRMDGRESGIVGAGLDFTLLTAITYLSLEAATRERDTTMSVYKRRGRWHFSKTINGVRHRGALPTARNKAQAEQAEAKIILELHQNEYGGRRSSPTLNDFVDRVFVPWAKANRRSWRSDAGRLKSIKRFFGAKRLTDISPFLIERFKVERRSSAIRHP